jgi:hypothetical protein
MTGERLRDLTRYLHDRRVPVEDRIEALHAILEAEGRDALPWLVPGNRVYTREIREKPVERIRNARLLG